MRVHDEELGRLNETGLALFRRRRIGMIFQFFNLLDDLSALDNVALAAQLTGSRAAGRARSGPWNCSTSSASPTGATPTRRRSAAASGNASPWPGR